MRAPLSRLLREGASDVSIARRLSTGNRMNGAVSSALARTIQSGSIAWHSAALVSRHAPSPGVYGASALSISRLQTSCLAWGLICLSAGSGS
jgi:hypothetical protein